MNETQSVYQLEPSNRIYEIMNEMKIIMVKGIGYVVVSKSLENPETFRHMGEVVAKAHEETES